MEKRGSAVVRGVNSGMKKPAGDDAQVARGQALFIPKAVTTRPLTSAVGEAFRAIEADLEAFSPGRVAAVGVRGGLAEGERVF